MKRLSLHIVFLLSSLIGFAQENDKQVIQFTGVIFGPDSISVIPGVHVYVPEAGRGTTSNPYGFFSMPVLEGDSIVFSAVGFERAHYVVPPYNPNKTLKTIVTLKEDVEFLEEVEVFPYPSESMFKDAVLAVKLPGQEDMDNLQNWLSQQYMKEAYRNLASSPGANHQYFMDLQMQMSRKHSSYCRTPGTSSGWTYVTSFIRNE